MSGKTLSLDFANKVYTILVIWADANESMRDNFIYAHTDIKEPCWEYRFQGVFGFGGKYWSDRNAISYYPEDHTKKLDKQAEFLEDKQEFGTWRRQVPGGWLVRVRDVDYRGGGEALCFLSDPNYEWKVK